jgi:hypothetical protein
LAARSLPEVVAPSDSSSDNDPAADKDEEADEDADEFGRVQRGKLRRRKSARVDGLGLFISCLGTAFYVAVND